jgi:hypothetical protein
VRYGFRDVARVRRDRFLIANIPASVHVRTTRVKLGRNLRKSGFWKFISRFGVVLHAAVPVLQTRDLTRRTYALRLSS